MKYTTKSGKELPPEVVEVIEKLKKEYGENNCIAFGLNWLPIPQTIDKAMTAIYMEDNFTEFYKLYPKKDVDSYGNEIVKGEMVEVRDSDKDAWVKKEFICTGGKKETEYVCYYTNFTNVNLWKICRKINTQKSELETKREGLLQKLSEIETKIKEL